MTLQIVFFGTPGFAVPSLTALVDAEYDIRLVVTQPDRPVGRHASVRPSAVAEAAGVRGIPTAKPEKVRGDAALQAELEAARPDVIAVVAFGRLLPSEILALPRLGCMNVHASLLPKYRGASPIQAAILAGDRETGVVTMKMEEGLDTGPVYLERRVAIGDTETAGELSGRLARIGGSLLVETLRGLEAGTLSARPQQGEPSLCRPIRREDGRIDWDLAAPELLQRLRAYTPWPGSHTILGGERVKVLQAEPWSGAEAGPPGTLQLVDGQLRVIAGGGTALRLLRLQSAGRKPVSGAEFAGTISLPSRFENSR